MIRLQWSVTQQEGLRVEMRSHAGAARNPEGHDLVCAAASMLCITLAQALTALCDAPRIGADSGWAELYGVPRPGEGERLRTAWQTVLGGFEWLQRQYPRCLEVRPWM